MNQPAEQDLARARAWLQGTSLKSDGAPWSTDEKWIARAFVQERERIAATLRKTGDGFRDGENHEAYRNVGMQWAADALECGEM